jgi:hypothetical protein
VIRLARPNPPAIPHLYKGIEATPFAMIMHNTIMAVAERYHLKVPVAIPSTTTNNAYGCTTTWTEEYGGGGRGQARPTAAKSRSTNTN